MPAYSVSPALTNCLWDARKYFGINLGVRTYSRSKPFCFNELTTCNREASYQCYTDFSWKEWSVRPTRYCNQVCRVRTLGKVGRFMCSRDYASISCVYDHRVGTQSAGYPRLGSTNPAVPVLLSMGVNEPLSKVSTCLNEFKDVISATIGQLGF